MLYVAVVISPKSAVPHKNRGWVRYHIIRQLVRVPNGQVLQARDRLHCNKRTPVGIAAICKSHKDGPFNSCIGSSGFFPLSPEDYPFLQQDGAIDGVPAFGDKKRSAPFSR